MKGCRRQGPNERRSRPSDGSNRRGPANLPGRIGSGDTVRGRSLRQSRHMLGSHNVDTAIAEEVRPVLPQIVRQPVS